MGTTNSNRRMVWIAASLGLLAMIAGFVYWWSIPPQMGASEEVFDTVDALFTAITSHDEKRLADCEKRLNGFSESGKLPVKAGNFLEGVIRKARVGNWQSAAESLYNFMLAQRRDGFEGTHKPTTATKKKK